MAMATAMAVSHLPLQYHSIILPLFNESLAMHAAHEPYMLATWIRGVGYMTT